VRDGLPPAFTITPFHQHDFTQLPELINAVSVPSCAQQGFAQGRIILLPIKSVVIRHVVDLFKMSEISHPL
jgi:hypothetical protein